MYAVVNESKIELHDTKELLSYLWQIPFQHAEYSPVETIKENVTSMGEMIREALSLEKEILKNKKAENKFDIKRLSTEKANITRMITRTDMLIKYAKKKKNKGELYSLVYEMIMSLEGKTLLHGFGFCKKVFKDPLRGNPEKDSILKEV